MDKYRRHTNFTNKGFSVSTTPLDIGILPFVSYHEPGGTAEQAFEDVIRLFQFSERLGLDSGQLRVRHFERSLTGVFPYLAALARETERISLGTAVVPIAHESAVRLAEDAATVDLLSGGRLELGVATGIAQTGPLADAFATAYRQPDGFNASQASGEVLLDFLRALRGEELANTDAEFRLQFTDPGEGLRVYPRSEGLLERIWYGSGSQTSVVRAAKLGLNLQVSTINSLTPTGVRIPDEQAELIDLYDRTLQEGFDLGGGITDPRPRRVSISRYVVPYTTAEEKERFIAASDRHVPRWPTLNGEGWNVGTVDEVIEQLVNDASIRRARKSFQTTLLLNLPSTLGLEWTQHLLEKIHAEVLPEVERATAP